MNQWRDVMCGEPRADRVGERLTLAGWAARRRDHGGLVFIDLRDHTGICQLVVNPERSPEAAAVAHQVRNEFVLRAEGELVRRAPDAVNPELPTGEVELQVDALEIVSRSEPLPFQLDEEGVDELMRLRYRYLDLRRDRMQRNLRLGGAVVSAMRRYMESQGFVDVWTPLLTKATPEGARDFVVPVRLQPGRILRAPAVAAALQADPDGGRLRPLLPDRDLPPGRGSARRPPVRAPAAGRGDGLPGARGRLGRDRGRGLRVASRRWNANRRSARSGA